MTPHQLFEHDDRGQPWPAQVQAAAFGGLADACQAALAVRALRVARGEQPRGFKVGFTNRTLWERYKVCAPIWGTVWDTTLTFCNGSGELDLACTCQPRIEPELVFGIKARPKDNADLDDLYAAIGWVATGFEIVQSHRPGWKFTAPETVADAGLHARLLVGPRVPLDEIAGSAQELSALLARVDVTLQKIGAQVDQGVGGNVLDSPLNALLHFIKELRQCPGAPDLEAGDIVTTGIWTDAWPVLPGQRWSAQFGAPLRPLQVDFR